MEVRPTLNSAQMCCLHIGAQLSLTRPLLMNSRRFLKGAAKHSVGATPRRHQETLEGKPDSAPRLDGVPYRTWSAVGPGANVENLYFPRFLRIPLSLGDASNKIVAAPINRPLPLCHNAQKGFTPGRQMNDNVIETARSSVQWCSASGDWLTTSCAK